MPNNFLYVRLQLNSFRKRKKKSESLVVGSLHRIVLQILHPVNVDSETMQPSYCDSVNEYYAWGTPLALNMKGLF